MKDLSHRILRALKLRAMTAKELAKALSCSEQATRSALAKLLDARSISAASCSASRNFRAPPRLYRLASETGFLLGVVRAKDVLSIAGRIGELLMEHGELAVFINAARVATAVLHHEPGYNELLHGQADCLVGRYRRADDELYRPRLVAEDIVGRLAELRPSRRRASA